MVPVPAIENASISSAERNQVCPGSKY